jgi:hypothetical protein
MSCRQESDITDDVSRDVVVRLRTRAESGTMGAVSIGLRFIFGGAAVALVLVLVAFLLGRKRSPRLYELGPISAHWLSEHQTHSPDSER